MNVQPPLQELTGPPSRRLLAYLARYRTAFLRGFACAVLTTGLSLATPWVLKLAIDDLTAAVTMQKVRLYAVLIVLLAAAGGVFRFLMRRIVIGASREFEYDLRNDFYAQLQRLDAGFYQHYRTGDLMSRATADLAAVRMLIGPAVMYTTTTGLTFLVATTLMLSIDRWLTAVALLPLPFVSLTVRYFGSAIHRHFDRIQQQLSDVSVAAQESLSGVRVVRAYGQERFELSRFAAANQEYVRRNRALIAIQGMYFPSMGLLMGIGALLVLWLGGRRVIAGQMSVGELVAFNTYLMMLAWPMIAFGWVTNLVQRGTASWKRLLEIIDTEPSIVDPPTPAEGAGAASAPALPAARAIRGDVEFVRLTFAYGDHLVLRDVSAVIPAGSTTAIVGSTGSGKSTLLRLLPRLIDPPPGTVFIDGTDVREIPLSTLRGAIGFVPQEPFLFSTTIAENIAFGASDAAATRAEVERVGAIARLDKDLRSFPDGYDTLIGERGLTLSGGQKQRTALARALLVDPAILLLDDAFSAVDTQTEDEILTRLAAATQGRTTIMVSHRVSTVRGADQILVLEDGVIAERGTHDALIRRNGIYAELHRRQLLEEELEAS